MSTPQTAPPCAFVIFGITGDLAARKLMPALFALHRAGSLHHDTRIVGYSRRDWTDDTLRQEMQGALETFAAKQFDAAVWDDLAPRFSFVRGSYDEPGGYKALARHLSDLGQSTRIFYTSTPPGTYEPIVQGLKAAGLGRSEGGDARLVIEKPFGNDLASARRLNAIVQEGFKEEQVYRIDHYLAKETAQNIAALRFANTIFEPLWNNRYVDHVQITMAEDIGVEGRGSFYEAAGVVRDVFQNHLLQLVALTATEPPASYDATSVRDEKVKLFRALCCVNPERAVKGQYVTNGDVRGYRDEDEVSTRSNQGTYAAVEFGINNWRWAGVPFFVRSGKRLEVKASEIVLKFKVPPHVPFTNHGPVDADTLILRLQPDEGISLRFDAKVPGQGVRFREVSLDFSYDQQFERGSPDAYETLILDAMQGDATLFMRADEVEEQWKIVTPLLEAWEHPDAKPAFYEAGTWGPREADLLLEKTGRRWYTP